MLRALKTFRLFLLVGLVGLAGAQELQSVPKLSTHVTDLTQTFSAEQTRQLEAKLTVFEHDKGAQIAVLLVPTVKPETVEQYALRVVDAWKLGRQGVDDGALLLLAKEDRKLRIEVGYGLEGALNDATAKRIISETMRPRLKENDFYGAINAGTDVMIQVIGGEALPPPKNAASPKAGRNNDLLLPLAFIFVFVVGGVLRRIFGRLAGAGITAAALGLITFLLLSSLLLAGVVGIIAFFLGLFSGRSGSGWSSGGGSWGGGSGGAGSFGGFSGGGGGFGGGGASGDW